MRPVGKAALRRWMRARLKAQRSAERQRASRMVARRLCALPAFRRAKTVMVYLALPYELDTAAIIRRARRLGKRIVVPVSATKTRRIIPTLLRQRRRDDGAVQAGPFGIAEPQRPHMTVSPNDIDLVVVPGVAFDRHGRRLGHGHGYYDRFLKRLPASVPRIGIGFTCQVVERLPATAWDVPLDRVLTA